MEHLSQEQLDAMVMGTASRDDEAVRRHLATCEACARRLAREAQLESDLYDAAASAATNVVAAKAIMIFRIIVISSYAFCSPPNTVLL